MRNAVAVSLFTAICLMILGCPGNELGSEPEPSTPTNPSEGSPVSDGTRTGPIEVSAEDLFAAYAADPGKADESYTGKSIVVRGVVAGLEKNLRKQHLVSLAAGEDHTVLAILASTENENGNYLRVGDELVVSGVCFGKGWMTVEIRDGKLESPVDQSRPAAVGRMDGDVFVRPDLGIRISLPKGWRHNPEFAAGLVQTFEPVENAHGQFSYPANITVVWFEMDGMTLKEQVRLAAESISLKIENAELFGTESGQVAGHPASFVAYRHGSPAMPAFELAVTIQNGKRFLRLVGSAPADQREKYEKLFREIAGSLSWK